MVLDGNTKLPARNLAGASELVGNVRLEAKPAAQGEDGCGGLLVNENFCFRFVPLNTYL